MSIASFIRRLLLAAEGAVNASVDRALGEEVPLDVLLDDAAEMMSAEAYDDTPDMDVEAGIVYGPINPEGIVLRGRITWIDSEGFKRVFGPDANEPDAMRAREQETAELEDLLALPAFERGQA